MIKKKILSEKLFHSSKSKKLKIINKFFKDLINNTNITNKQLNEMLNGATIVIYNDNYKYFKKIKQLCGPKIGKHSKKLINKFKTSHNDIKGQYRCNKPNITLKYSKQKIEFDLLVGKGNTNINKPSTWFQLEKSNINLNNILSHSKDFINHKINNINIGPLGTSKFTETHPIIIKLNNT